MNLILRPLMPPSALILLKYRASVIPMVPYAEFGPLYGMVLPILISVSVAPTSYFFWANALPVVTAKAMTANAEIRNTPESIVSPHSSVFLELADQVLGH